VGFLTKQDLVIVGAGPAGCAAAIQATRLGRKPVLIDARGEPGGLLRNAFLVENYPGLEEPLPGRELVRRLAAQLRSFDIRVTQDKAMMLHHNERAKRFIIFGEKELEARAVIVAVGTYSREVEIDGEKELSGTLLFDEVLPALGLKPARAAVIGGGEAALDYALSLAAAGARVDVLARSGVVKACERLVERVRQESRIRIDCESIVCAMRKVGGAVQVDFVACRPRVYDVCVVAVGRRSRASRFLGTLPEDIIGNGSVKTNIPGLFLAGDARLGSLGQAGIAVGDGLECAMEAHRYLAQRESEC